MSNDELVTVRREDILLWTDNLGIAMGQAAKILAETPPTTKRQTNAAADKISALAEDFYNSEFPMAARFLIGLETGLRHQGPIPKETPTGIPH
jgi:hypothetical protein